MFKSLTNTPGKQITVAVVGVAICRLPLGENTRAEWKIESVCCISGFDYVKETLLLGPKQWLEHYAYVEFRTVGPYKGRLALGLSNDLLMNNSGSS